MKTGGDLSRPMAARLCICLDRVPLPARDAPFKCETLRDKRDYAIVAVLLGCGLRRGELATVSVQDLQQREEHWVFADLAGKGGHIRTVPIPDWVGNALNSWTSCWDHKKANLSSH
jgi:integrase